VLGEQVCEERADGGDQRRSLDDAAGALTSGNQLDDVVLVIAGIGIGAGSCDDLDVAGVVEVVQSIGEAGVVEDVVRVVGESCRVVVPGSEVSRGVDVFGVGELAQSAKSGDGHVENAHGVGGSRRRTERV
jgi:hypothetical protein